MDKLEDEIVSKSKINIHKILLFRRPALIILSPLFLSPLLLHSDPAIKCAFVVLLMAIYWTSEIMPLAVTALLPVVLFPLIGILTSKEVSHEFMNDTVFLFIGGLIVATAVERCGLHLRVALFVLSLVGSQPKRIMFGFMTVTAVLSMFISNTATAAMMLPICQSVINLLENTKTLESNRGGGDSEKCLIENELLQEEILPKNDFNIQIEEQQNLSKTNKNNNLAKALVLSVAFSANIGGVGTPTGTSSNLVLIGILPVLFPGIETGLNYLSWIVLTVPLMIFCLFMCWILLTFIFLRNCPKVDETVGILLKKQSDGLPPMSYDQKSVAFCFLLLLFLWIFRRPGFMPGISDIFPDNSTMNDSTSAIFVAILLFVLPSENPLNNFMINIKRNKSEKSKCLMDWATMQKQFPWGVVLLLGGGFAMAAGVRASELSTLMAQTLSKLDYFPIWAIQLIAILVTMLVTNICSNTVTASIFIPIFSTMAQKVGIHPISLMLPATLSSSFAFILPVGTASNTIAFSSGLINVSDMILSGIAMSLVTAISMLIYLATFVPYILPINDFPEWAAFTLNESFVENNNFINNP
uniref:Uncharacterized protein n=1 Tax=Meloidogyne incognita TaxID=6306 RepID=A0A914NCA4_MELIC